MSPADAKEPGERAGVAPFSSQALMPMAGAFAVALAMAEVIVDWGKDRIECVRALRIAPGFEAARRRREIEEMSHRKTQMLASIAQISARRCRPSA